MQNTGRPVQRRVSASQESISRSITIEARYDFDASVANLNIEPDDNIILVTRKSRRGRPRTLLNCRASQVGWDESRIEVTVPGELYVLSTRARSANEPVTLRNIFLPEIPPEFNDQDLDRFIRIHARYTAVANDLLASPVSYIRLDMDTPVPASAQRGLRFYHLSGRRTP